MNIVYGILWGIIGQVLSFVQLQAAIKWGWWDKYYVFIMASAIPAVWCYKESVDNFIRYFGGTLYESRLLGFSIGIIVFVVMSHFLFKEPVTLKVIISLVLATIIVLVQTFMK
jgi:hypothetical protein